ncbi:MAG: DUF1800 domain-containing protein [Phycisphaerales bacterium]
MSANPLHPLPEKGFDVWKAQHLLNRAGFGGSPADARALRDLGIAKAVDRLVDFDSIDADPAPEWDRDIMRPPTAEELDVARRARAANDEATLARLQRERQDREMRDRGQLAEAQRWWMRRVIETGRPLEEKLTLFWHGHFATGYRTIEDSWHMIAQNGLFRANAAGNFATLVAAVVHDPAMLKYLDNDENRRNRPNENLARELMELFVLGEGNGYTETDIKEAARALTGYTFRDDQFSFDANEHDPTPKQVLGVRGALDGDDVVRILLRRQDASEFICLKLYRFFVNDAPGKLDEQRRDVVKAMARELREAKYELRPMLKALFRSEHFYADANQGQVIKSPIQLIAQTIRSYRTPTRSLSTLVAAADLMGQQLFQPPNVKGWEGGRTWINTATYFVRQNIAIYLLTGRRPSHLDWAENADRFDATPLVADLKDATGGAPDPVDLATFLLRFSLGTVPSPQRVDTIAGFLRSTAGAPENDRLIGGLALVTALPEYQLC